MYVRLCYLHVATEQRPERERERERERETEIRTLFKSIASNCEVYRTNAASRAGKTRGKDEDGVTDAGPDMSWYITSAMFNRFPGLPEFLELPWAPWNCWLTRVKVPKCQCRLGFSNGDRVSDAARAAFKDTHTDLRCAEFGRNLAMVLQDPSCGRISKMDRSKSRMTYNDGCLQRCTYPPHRNKRRLVD